MSTQAEMHRLLKPIAERHSDLFVWKRSLVIKPVHHFLRYVLLDNTSIDHGFISSWGVNECFSTSGHQHISYTLGLEGRAQELRRLNVPESVQSVIDSIENRALPALREMSKFDDPMAFIEGPLFPLRPYGGYMDCSTALMEIGGGHLDKARPRLEAIAAAAKIWRGSYLDAEISPIVDDLKPLVDANDRKGVGALLLTWEERWIRKNKLERFWEPTPFPVELG